MALAPLPESRFRFDIRKSVHAEAEAPLVEGCECPACERHSRAYLHYLSREQELTAVRLLSLHNLSYLERLARAARAAIAGARFDAFRLAVLDGRAPWDA